MEWVIYALLTALSLSTVDALCKRALRRNDEYTIALVREAYALPFLALVLPFIEIPALDRTFWITLAILLPLEVTALLLYVRAIRVSPLSLTIPFTATTPLFILFIAFLILGEWPDLSGLIGVMLIVTGAYVLNIDKRRESLLAPLRAIGRERGSLYMLGVAFIYAITSTLGKVAIMHSSPIFFGLFYPFTLTISLSVVVGVRKRTLREVVRYPFAFLTIGLFTAMMIIFHFLALSLTNVAYMISVKRTSLIFSLLYGKLLFNEEALKERLAGSLLMLAGVVSITLL